MDHWFIIESSLMMAAFAKSFLKSKKKVLTQILTIQRAARNEQRVGVFMISFCLQCSL
jgi:hypothetical protein